MGVMGVGGCSRVRAGLELTHVERISVQTIRRGREKEGRRGLTWEREGRKGRRCTPTLVLMDATREEEREDDDREGEEEGG